MTDGIKFKRGTHKLELTKNVVSYACMFPESVKISDRKSIEFFHQFVDDVTKFEEKVNIATKPYYDKSTEEIVQFLKSAEKSENPVSVYSKNGASVSDILKTALVQCNFTDITRFIGDLKKKLHEKVEDEDDEEMEVDDEEDEEITLENLKISRVEEIIVTECDSIHSIIDRIEASKADLLVLIVQQFESLPPQMLDSIISLIFSKESINKYVNIVRLVVCFSTSNSFIKTSCSMETLNRLDMHQFQFTRLDEIFEKIISSNISPAVFSGQFLNYLRNRFFQCDYSVSAIIKAVQFAFLQKYINDPMWKIDGEFHEKELEKYWRILKLFRGVVFYNEVEEWKLHIDIQSNEDGYWDKLKEENMGFREWKARSFGSSIEDLKDCICAMIKEMEEIDPNWCDEAQKLIFEREKAEKEQKNAKPTEKPATTTPKNMKFHELQKMQKLKVDETKNKNAAVENVTNQLFELVMSVFKSFLKPYPTSWRNVIGSEVNSSSSIFQTSLDSNDEFDIEKCLLNTKKYENEPLSIAWKSLLSQDKFKTVPLLEWAEGFVKNKKIAKKDQREAFFGSAGQLEHMGLIRGNADRKNTNVHILYHPVSQIVDY